MDRIKVKLYPLFFAAIGVLAAMGGGWRAR
jgi:hypothetical protein